MTFSGLHILRAFSAIFLVFFLHQNYANATQSVQLGVVKVDLLQQYLGTASNGDGSPAFRKVTRSMATMALDDARDVGATFVRVAITGTYPAISGKRSDLDLWMKNPTEYWKIVDGMMNDLAIRELKIVPVFTWNFAQFPNIAGEKLDQLLRNPESQSWKLLAEYVKEFVSRYKDHQALLFYELGGEPNVYLDLDLEKRCNQGAKILVCSASANHSSADVIEFTRRLAELIKPLDNAHKISSGYSIPRPSAQHLRARPEWSPRGPDWTLDNVNDLVRNLADMHQHVDIISVHLYPIKGNQRFGSGDGEEYRLTQIVKQAADQIGKPLFIGEFGDMDARNAGPGGFADRMLNQVIHLNIQYAAIWGWELYIKNTYTSYDNMHTLSSLEPGNTDYLIGRFKQTAASLGAHVQTSSKSDKIPPRVVLTWPLECSRISGVQTLYAVASDSGDPVERVEFLANGEVVDTKTKPPYQTSWNAQGQKPGEYTLTARAYDRAGNKADYSTVVLVNTAKAISPTCAATGQ